MCSHIAKTVNARINLVIDIPKLNQMPAYVTQLVETLRGPDDFLKSQTNHKAWLLFSLSGRDGRTGKPEKLLWSLMQPGKWQRRICNTVWLPHMLHLVSQEHDRKYSKEAPNSSAPHLFHLRPVHTAAAWQCCTLSSMQQQWLSITIWYPEIRWHMSFSCAPK